MRLIAFLFFIASFSLFIYMKFIIDDERASQSFHKINNDPKEMKRLRAETIEFKKEMNNVFHETPERKNNK